jgi:ribonuclease HI
MILDAGEKYSDYSLIVYTDGSANPNPGIIGACSVGYVFNREGSSAQSVEDVVTTDNFLFSDIGYIKNTSYTGNQRLVFPSFLFEMRNSFYHNFTNNYAEVYAVYSLLEYLVKNNLFFKSILIYSDSTYVVSSVMERLDVWKNNDWKKVDGKSIAEPDLWQKVSEYLDTLRSNGCSIKLEWIKGHSGNLGNELANFGANIARNDSHRNQYDNFIQVVKGEDYFNTKVDIHPLICFNNLIVNLSKNNKIYCQYNTDLPDNLVGKINRKSSYSIVILNNKEIRAIDNVINLLHRMKSYDSINFIKMDKIRNKKYYSRLVHFPYTSVITKKNSNTLVFMDNEVLSPEINPPGLLINALETYDVLLDILTPNLDFKSNVDSYVDITNYFYNVDVDKKQKVKYVLKNEFSVGQKNLILDININSDVGMVGVPVVLGLDLPERNVLKKLESYDPTIWILFRFTSNQCFEYYFVIETIDAISIWQNKSSSRIVLDKK